ncbi:MAG: carboxylating nicotinate-nucleotide diphosphorylase [Candidatus Omnitrophica bacterium]|nr:carboxylating nicotinate-nucleotide diphosphorylase [Candidatus Omnitrophota bacterium]
MEYNNNLEINGLITAALKEDIGSHDITTELIIFGDKTVRAVILAKEDCVLCGLGVASLVFKAQDEAIEFKSLAKEGSQVKKGTVLAEISGNARSIMTAERVALNFLAHLCGIASKTREFVLAVSPYKVRILDTRKTLPGMRILQKYAVRIGGGFNHRMHLDEMILVKDNHLKAIGGYKALQKITCGLQVELEVKNLKEFRAALKLNPNVIMLDNMNVTQIKKAVKERDRLCKDNLPKLEASGGANLKSVKKIASTGVDFISVGELTHSVRAIDLSLEIL